MCAVVGMLTEAKFTGPVIVTGCCRLPGDVMLTVLVPMFICAAMVTALLALPPRFTAEVMAPELVTDVVMDVLLCTLFESVKEKPIWVNLRLVNSTNILPRQNRKGTQPAMLHGCLAGSLEMSVNA